MFDTLFGEGYAFKILFAFIVVFGLLALALWLVRRFGGERLGNGTTRGRQPRLAVIDATSVDGRRKLVLVRRDNVEVHLWVPDGVHEGAERHLIGSASCRIEVTEVDGLYARCHAAGVVHPAAPLRDTALS